MIEHYEDVFPPLLEKKKAQAERVMPYRKRTALVDQRISRSDLGKDFDPQELLAQQQQAQRASLDGKHSSVEGKRQGLAQIPALDIPAAPEAQDGDDFKTPMGTPAVEGANPVASAPIVASPAVASPPVATIPIATPPAASPAAAAPPATPSAPVASESSPVDATTSGRTTPSRSSVHSIAADDVVIAASGGGLKRNTSSEASRLRGPKGARGPRPAPGHSQRGSVSKIAAQFENGGK